MPGLIPAHAGKTRPRASSPACTGAHPRSRGENAHPGRSTRHRRWLIPAHAGKTVAGDLVSHVCPAHPRSRGENASLGRGTALATGSSPLTRGKRGPDHRGFRRRGLIPAHAGKTHIERLGLSRTGAHPRSRGENPREALTRSSQGGSSPLTRGKHNCESSFHYLGRLIPAHAGKTINSRGGGVCAWAHPRSRGENHTQHQGVTQNTGSSPLTRGKLKNIGSLSRDGRLIPAHAGKTAQSRRWTDALRAHPRSRGENGSRRHAGRETRGSSPLTRGKHWPTRSVIFTGRLIPAHAGKTDDAKRSMSCFRAHPRSRGENHVTARRTHCATGSSPLTRGKPEDRRERRILRRLIPAHAGKTSCRRRRCRPRPAHPRSRGENSEIRNPSVWRGGSSPLTRGKLRRGGYRRCPTGLIPAHAGKTRTAQVRT